MIMKKDTHKRIKLIITNIPENFENGAHFDDFIRRFMVKLHVVKVPRDVQNSNSEKHDKFQKRQVLTI